MIIGAHSIIYSKSPDADRGFLRDALGLTGVDVGGGKLGIYQPRHARPKGMPAKRGTGRTPKRRARGR